MLAIFAAAGTGFSVGHSGPSALAYRAPVAQMGLFDGFAKAFENDSTLGKAGPAGLTKEREKKTVTWVGPNGQKKQSQVIPGQSLRDIARGSGIPIKYDCSEGTCKTCEAMVGNGRAKICVAKMPNKVRNERWYAQKSARANRRARSVLNVSSSALVCLSCRTSPSSTTYATKQLCRTCLLYTSDAADE